MVHLVQSYFTQNGYSSLGQSVLGRVFPNFQLSSSAPSGKRAAKSLILSEKEFPAFAV